MSDRLAKLTARVDELEAALRRARVVSESLRSVGMAVGTAVDLDVLFSTILDAMTHVLQADRATLYLRDGDCLVSRVKKGAELETIKVSLGTGIAGYVAQSGRALRIADAYADKRFDPTWDERTGYTTRSILAVPLTDYNGEIVGVVQALNKQGSGGEPARFTPYDTELLKALAMQAAVSLDKSNLFRSLVEAKTRLERRLSDLGLLYDLEVAMSRALTRQDLAQSVIEHVASACDAEAGALLFGSSSEQLRLFVVRAGQSRPVREVAVQPGEGIAGRAMSNNEILTIDGSTGVRDPRRVRELLGISVRSAIAAPLPGEAGRALGAIAVYNNTGCSSHFSDDDGAFLRLVSANVSTELRLFEERHERARAERLGSIGRLLSGVMHDLRTPLTIISGYVQLMEVAEESDIRAQYAKTVAEQFEAIGVMQRELLAYARGEKSIWIRKVYLGRFLTAIANQFKPELKDAKVELELQLNNSGTAYFDESKMTRALQNLARNALEAMKKGGGKLTFGCDREEDDLIFTVRDTGPGIPRSIRNRLFEPFTTVGKKTGTGLGLSIVKKIVEEHKGEVTVESSESGAGFIVRLPQAMRNQVRVREK